MLFAILVSLCETEISHEGTKPSIPVRDIRVSWDRWMC